MLLAAEDESLTVLNAGVVAVDLRLTKVVHSSNLVLNQVLPQIKSNPAAGLALRVTKPAATDVITLLCVQCCVYVRHGKSPTLRLPQCHTDVFRYRNIVPFDFT
ncbi:hypothetical protein ILYODFUR_009689 [Ilyodon furcidens]|uniref:Uncharacterized protein n=1 Tax=Ilyodon furcidens TaxID=33524 RepID=A0ABV0TJV0_9TELE